MAERALKITIASTLAVFSIEKEGEIETTFCPGLLSHPSPFNCSIRARSGVHEGVVRGLEERLVAQGDGMGDAEELKGVKW